MTAIPFNRPLRTGEEPGRVAAALDRGWTGSSGPASTRCSEQLRSLTGASRALMTHSCTAALEMAALLADVGPGDEVVMPSYTFVSTANAFVLRGATPVFADIDPATRCLDPARVADAITPRTRAVCCVHYAGVACDMGALRSLTDAHDLLLIEDAAQAIGASWEGAPLGTIGDIGALSFHETKNISCGEGGALLLRDGSMGERAEILHEKGTDRALFARGERELYTWIDVGSSYAMSDISAAILSDQLDRVDTVTQARREIWEAYHAALAPLGERGLLQRPHVPRGVQHNAHAYAVLAPDQEARDRVIATLAQDGISAYFHYVALHSSPAGRRYGRVAGPMVHTDAAAARLVRLPLWVGLSPSEVARVVAGVEAALA